MEKELKDILPVMGIEHDCILSKQGDVTIVFKVSLPEIFTLSDEDYETLHQAWVKAIRVLPKDSILHKQDWFIERQYRASKTSAGTRLSWKKPVTAILPAGHTGSTTAISW